MKTKIWIIVLAILAIIIALIGVKLAAHLPTDQSVQTEPSETVSLTEPTTNTIPDDNIQTDPTIDADVNDQTESTEPSIVATEPIVTEPPAIESTQPIIDSKPEEEIIETEPAENTKPKEEISDEHDSEILHVFQNVNETVYANTTVNIRSGPSTNYQIIGQLKYGDSVTRIGIGDGDWDKILYNNEEAYVYNSYIQTSKPASNALDYPLTYSDGSCTITIYKEWYKNAYCYAAHLQFSDYSRFGTSCANGKYNNGYETTSHAANRLGAIFAVNGCYSAPYLDYSVIRSGVIWNGAARNCWLPAVYSSHNGLLLSAWESGGDPRVAGQNIQSLVDSGLVTDSFCFGPPGLVNGTVLGSNSGARAQRTMIGTNGNPGDIWIVVSDGRHNDGQSAGLTFYEGMEYLQTKGCMFGVHLDGGGSSAMYFQGKVLNAARGGERAVVDFVYFK